MNDMSSSPSLRDYLVRVKDIAAAVSVGGTEIEQNRRLPPQLVRALTDGGFYRMLQPRFLGGAELSLDAFSTVVEALARLDASTAWCVAQCASCAMAAAYLDRDTALELFGPAEGIVAWGPPAPSEARVVDGGYRVTGTWNFASGGRQASWIGGQAYVVGRDGKPLRSDSGAPVFRMMLFPSKDVQMTDVWHVMGLKGTASDTYGVKDVFVPDRLSFARDEDCDRRENGLLFKFSTSNLYSFGFAAVALGIAQQMLDDAIKVASDKTPTASKRAMRDNNVIQAQIGRSEATMRGARHYLHGVARELWQAVAEHPEVTRAQKIEIRLCSTWVIHQAMSVADTVYHMLGSTAVFEKNPFERRFRDIHTLSQQLQGRQAHFESVGQVMLGLEPDTVLFTT